MESKKLFCGLAHIGLFTDCFEETMHFYTRQLPFRVVKQTVEEHPGDNSGYFPMKFALIELDGLYMEILECANHACTANGIPGVFNHLGIAVSDLDAAIEELMAKGVAGERFEPIVIGDRLIPGKSFRSCRVKGYNGELIGLYEIDNQTFFTTA